MTHLRVLSLIVGVGAVAIVGIAYASRSNRKAADQREQERRERLSMLGRISDGTVYDVQDSTDADGNLVQLLMYSYDVAGVSYEASQDITHLRQYVDVHSCRLGLPASVKYDPHNPGNSVVISENWSGLRRGLSQQSSGMNG